MNNLLTMNGLNVFAFFVPTFILLAGVTDDLLSRKVHNWLVVSAVMVALVFQIFLGGWEAVSLGLLGFASAFFLCLPLVLAKMLGAGDMKLLMAFGLSTNISSVLGVTIFSLVWGALLGLFQALIRGEMKSLLVNTLKIAGMKKPHGDYHRVPYTIAMFFGWLTQLTMEQTGVRLW